MNWFSLLLAIIILLIFIQFNKNTLLIRHSLQSWNYYCLLIVIIIAIFIQFNEILILTPSLQSWNERKQIV